MVFTAIMGKGTNRNRICLRKKQTQIPGYDLAVPQSAYHKGQAKEGRHGCACLAVYPAPEQRDKILQAGYHISHEDRGYSGSGTKKKTAGSQKFYISSAHASPGKDSEYFQKTAADKRTRHAFQDPGPAV